MAPPLDKGWEFLDYVISLADDIIQEANVIKDTFDDPEVLYAALKQESAALMIKKLTREYRPRLRYLKKITGSIDYEPDENKKRSVGQTSPRKKWDNK